MKGGLTMKKEELWDRICFKEKTGDKHNTNQKDTIHKTEQNWRKPDVEYGDGRISP